MFSMTVILIETENVNNFNLVINKILILFWIESRGYFGWTYTVQ